MSSKDNDEERVMHSESDNIEIMSHDKGDEFLEESSGGLYIDSSYSYLSILTVQIFTHAFNEG